MGTSEPDEILSGEKGAGEGGEGERGWEGERRKGEKEGER